MKTGCKLLFILANLCACAEIRLSLQPEISSGLPGELQTVNLCIEMDAPRNVVLRVPHASNLVLRAVERFPVSRSGNGGYLQRRQVVFQGVEPGVTALTNILVETGKEVHAFPTLTVEVREVEPAQPPRAAAEKSGNGKNLEEVLTEMPEKTRGTDPP